jgi:hypothetical protein
MPKIVRFTESVQGKISPTTKLKMLKYKERYQMTESEIIRRALEKFLHNTTSK